MSAARCSSHQCMQSSRTSIDENLAICDMHNPRTGDVAYVRYGWNFMACSPRGIWSLVVSALDMTICITTIGRAASIALHAGMQREYLQNVKAIQSRQITLRNIDRISKFRKSSQKCTAVHASVRDSALTHRAFSGKSPDRSRLGRCRVSGTFRAFVHRPRRHY